MKNEGNTKRNFTVSLMDYTGSKISSVSTFKDLAKTMLQDKSLLEQREKLLTAKQEGDGSSYDALKKHLKGFVIGNFTERNTTGCIEYEPIIGFDIDHLSDREQYATIIERIRRWGFTFVVFPSVSGQGIRILVQTDATKERHKDYYAKIAKAISDLIDIPLKSAIRKGMKEAGLKPDAIKAYLDENAHVDDVTSDIARFWYYSGVKLSEFYVNHQSEVFHVDTVQQEVKKSKPISKGSEYAYTFTERDKTEYLVSCLESAGVDITQGVSEWFKLGMAFYDEFGESGNEYFCRISQFHADYKSSECDEEWNRIKSKYKPNQVSIATFYKWCAQEGISIDYNDLMTIHADKFNVPKKERKKAVEEKEVKENLYKTDLETAIITTCVEKPSFIDTIYDICPRFNPECFFIDWTRKAFEKILVLRSKGLYVSRESVFTMLEGSNVARRQLDAYKGYKSSSENFTTNVKICYDLYLKRVLRDVSTEMSQKSHEIDIDVFDTLNEFGDKISNLGDYGATDTENTPLQLSQKMIKRYDAIAERRKLYGDGLSGLDWGFSRLNDMTGGIQDSDLVILAARPGMGKTSMALKYASINASKGDAVGLFSLEMSADQLANRIVSIRKGIDGKKIRQARLDKSEQRAYFTGIEEFSNTPIYVDDKAGATIQHIESIARKWKRKHDIKILIVDYLQLITANMGRGASRENEVSHISRRLKCIAKDLNIPVIALSQLSRAVETRGGDKRPMLSDLRESGSIEQDADMVMFIYRAEYYGINEDEEGESLAGIAETIVAKNRHGETGTILTGFKGETTDFYDLETQPQSDPYFDNDVPETYNPTIQPTRSELPEEPPF